jgi:phosphoglycolate phosphatase-like HAD superfamily hydrolase
MFSSYIFDVEGTLIDSVSQNLSSLQEALEQAGFRYAVCDPAMCSGLDGDQTLQIITDLAASQRKQILRAHARIYETIYLHCVNAFGGVREMFETLTRRGGRVALATDCKGPELKHYLSLLNIDEFIEVMCGDDVEHGKPDPAL